MAVPVSDTIKRVENDVVLETVPRDDLVSVQTPQAFRTSLLLEAFAWAIDAGVTVTDEATLIESLGHVVQIVPGRTRQHQGHLPFRPDPGGSLVAGANAMIRTGIGYDIHPFADGRRLVLGGVEIASDRGLAGHSDADVLLHALADALLGAAALGDIGHLFPPTDASIAGIDSRVILRASVTQVREAGYDISNVDVTLIAEHPRIAPYIEAMRSVIAQDLGLRRRTWESRQRPTRSWARSAERKELPR